MNDDGRRTIEAWRRVEIMLGEARRHLNPPSLHDLAPWLARMTAIALAVALEDLEREVER